MKVMNMRKEYKKPSLIYEDFRLMDAIASNCMIFGQHDSKLTCSWFSEDFDCNIFTQGVDDCDFIYDAYEIPEDIVFPS